MMLNVAHCVGYAFYNLFYIIMEKKKTLDVEQNIETPNSEPKTTESDTVDYKALFEAEKENAEKWKNRYKSSKANEHKGWDVNPDEIQAKIDESLGTFQFYSNNESAVELREDIESLVAKGYDRNDAFVVVASKKDPSLLLDDAKKAQLAGWTALSWVPIVETHKQISDLSTEDIRTMPIEELREKYMPLKNWWQKFYWDR